MASYNTKTIFKKENRKQHRVVIGPQHFSYPAGQSTEWSLPCMRGEGYSQDFSPILWDCLLYPLFFSDYAKDEHWEEFSFWVHTTLRG